MRKVLATVLALPVLAAVYAAAIGRASLARLGAGVGAAAVVAVVGLAGLPPAQSSAVPVAATPAPVGARVVEALATGHGLREPLRVEFDAAMDPSSVAAAMRLAPDAAVTFAWDADRRVLTVRPVAAWRPDTLYVLTVSTAARAVDGGTLAAPLRAAVLTARAGTVRIEATRPSGGAVRVDTAFRIVLDRPVTLAAVRAALRTTPAIEGTVAAGAGPEEFLFTPAAPLAADTGYELLLVGLRDADGVAFEGSPGLAVRTGGAPSVVRFRPLPGTAKVSRTAPISVRFTERMDRATTAPAFRVTANGKPVSGRIAWAEAGTVLVFAPEAPLPYGAKVVASVAASAASRAGAPLAAASSATFTVVPRPAPARPPSDGGTKPIDRGGGGAVAGNWVGVELYYLRLMNCTRTGGWVTSEGNCKSPGGRDVAPLVLNRGISSTVARPYAKLLATRNICSHFIGGTPGDRLRRAGYTSYRWGENLGCRSGNPYAAVLGSHRYFQGEKPYNGGHYRNLMDARFRQAGIGVWVSHGRVRLVVDFYTP